jgi:hypothetical protein
MALAALCVAAPIPVAHEGNPNYRSTLRQIAPSVPGLEARVLGYDDRIELRYDGDSVVVLEGYREEPYLRFHPDGRVEVNRRSPAAYLNEDRFAQVEVPGRADHEAPPRWELIARTGRYDWHDHRIHWMGEGTLPPQVKDEAERTKVFDWTIPASAGGQPFRLSGTLTWLGEQSEGFPVAAAVSLAGVLLGGALLVVVVRRRRGRGGRTAKSEVW